MLNINKYIDWNKIWNEEIDLESSIEDVCSPFKDLLQTFRDDKSLVLELAECDLVDDKRFKFVFAEHGGANESDSVGWFRRYDVFVYEDFEIYEIYYEQG